MASWKEVFTLAGGFARPGFGERVRGLLDAFLSGCKGITGVFLAVYSHPEKNFLKGFSSGRVLLGETRRPLPPPPGTVLEQDEEVYGEKLKTVTLPLYTAHLCAALKVFYGRDILFKSFAYLPELKRLLDGLTMALEIHEAARTLQVQNREFVHSLAAALDARDVYTRLHSSRTAQLAVLLAIALGLSSREIDVIKRGSLLHDIGKLAVPDRVLFKKGPLTAEEKELIKIHPEAGAHIVRNRALAELVPVILFHHERADGSGYPTGLKGREIPLEAQILSVADVYEALTADRAYRPAQSHEEAKKTMVEDMKGQFAPRFLEKFFGAVESSRLLNPAAAGELIKAIPADKRDKYLLLIDYFLTCPFEITSTRELQEQLGISEDALQEGLFYLLGEGFLCRLEAYDVPYYFVPVNWKGSLHLSKSGEATGLPAQLGARASETGKDGRESLLEYLTLKCLEGEVFTLYLVLIGPAEKYEIKTFAWPDAALGQGLKDELRCVLPKNTRLFWPEKDVMALVFDGEAGKSEQKALSLTVARINELLLGCEIRCAAGRFPYDGETAPELYYGTAAALRKKVPLLVKNKAGIDLLQI